MQKIIPHLWFDKNAEEATKFYVSLFENSNLGKATHYSKEGFEVHHMPEGTVMTQEFTLAGQSFMALNGGPIFKFNPSISFFVVFDNEEDIKKTWDALIDGGKALMEYNTYPWAEKYGWLQDKYGLSWQLSWSVHHKLPQKITPLLMFTQDKAGKAREAMELYTSVFPDSNIDMVATYEAGEGDDTNFIKHARFTLMGQGFMAMDSSGPHEFVFNEAISLMVNCKDQAEIDTYWEKLSAVPESEQCGWLKDKFGVSWQIVPGGMSEFFETHDKEAVGRAMNAMLAMKKIDIAEMERAAKGE